MVKPRFKLIPAVYLVLRRDDMVLMLRRANTGYQDGKLSLVAGHLEGDELASEAMRREAKEEADIVIESNNLKLVHLSHRLSRNEVDQERLDLFFETRDYSGEIKNLEPHKCSELSWFKIEQLPKDTIPFIRHVLGDISKGINYSEYETEPTN